MKGGHVDWDALKRTMAERERTLAATMSLDEGRRLALLRQRARLLAAPPAGARPNTIETALVFQLGREVYAIDLLALRQVVPLAKLVAVPGAPEGIVGVMSLGGEIGTVWSLSRILGVPPGEPGERCHVLVLKAPCEIGLLIDYVEGTRDIDVGGLIRAGVGGVALPLRFLRGLLPDGAHLLDAGALRAAILSTGKQT